MKPVFKRREVASDLTDIYVWIAEDNLDAAERFLAAVDRTFSEIQRNPELGWGRPWKIPELAGMRSRRVRDFPNILIFYREEQGAIQIYAVLSGYRDLEPALKKRRR